MKKTLIQFIFLSLLSLFVVACGAAGGDAGYEEPGFGDELVDEENQDVVEEDELDEEDPDGEDLDEEDLDEEEPEVEAPFCGDGFVDEGEACDDGNTEDGDGCSSVCEEEAFAGATDGDIAIDVIIDDLNSNAPPAQADCADLIDLETEDGELFGEGTCSLPANFLTYTLDAVIDSDGVVSGEIDIVLNNRSNVVPVTGTFTDGVLELGFEGVTPIVGSIRGIWNGTIDASFD